MKTVITAWTPTEWAAVLTAVIAAVASAIVSVITAIQHRQLVREVRAMRAQGGRHV